MAIGIGIVGSFPVEPPQGSTGTPLVAEAAGTGTVVVRGRRLRRPA